jgi:hypothetical protein
MKSILSWLGVLLLAGAAVPAAYAQPYPCYPPVAPDACVPGYYSQGRCGMTYGPNYYLRPPFEPFNGFVPPVCRQGARGWPGAGAAQGPLNSPVFPTHPYARSPRDYFMIDLP